MPLDTAVRETMVAEVPSLRELAISLCGDVDRADDLVQVTLLRAVANIDSYKPGTDTAPQLSTILRDEYRKRAASDQPVGFWEGDDAEYPPTAIERLWPTQ